MKLWSFTVANEDDSQYSQPAPAFINLVVRNAVDANGQPTFRSLVVAIALPSAVTMAMYFDDAGSMMIGAHRQFLRLRLSRINCECMKTKITGKRWWLPVGPQEFLASAEEIESGTADEIFRQAAARTLIPPKKH